jgi:hypothetical protein
MTVKKKPAKTKRVTRLAMLKRTREIQRGSSHPRSFDSLVSWLEGKVKPRKVKK